MTPDTLTLTPLALYTLLAGFAATALVEWAQRWSWFVWLWPNSTKLRKALVAALVSVLSATMPAFYAYATAQIVPDWSAIGDAAWRALLTFLVASGAWAVLLHKSASANGKTKEV